MLIPIQLLQMLRITKGQNIHSHQLACEVQPQPRCQKIVPKQNVAVIVKSEFEEMSDVQDERLSL